MQRGTMKRRSAYLLFIAVVLVSLCEAPSLRAQEIEAVETEVALLFVEASKKLLSVKELNELKGIRFRSTSYIGYGQVDLLFANNEHKSFLCVDHQHEDEHEINCELQTPEDIQ